MKKIKYLFMAVIMAWAIQICIVDGVNEAQAATTSTATTVTEKKNGLYKENGKNYYYTNGKKIRNQWKKINGKRYYFGPKYYAVTYHNKISGKIYVFDTSGQLLNGKKSRIVNVGKNSYYVNKYGNPSTGWLYLSDKNLYYADSCIVVQLSRQKFKLFIMNRYI